MDFVMNSKFAVPATREIKVMMNVMKHAVKEEASRESCEEAKDVGHLKVDPEDKPYQSQKAGCEKPRHADERLGFFMMELMARVGECFAAMIDPAMEAVLKQRPADQTARIRGEEIVNVGL